jgi:hypothetical protein
MADYQTLLFLLIVLAQTTSSNKLKLKPELELQLQLRSRCARTRSTFFEYDLLPDFETPCSKFEIIFEAAIVKKMALG